MRTIERGCTYDDDTRDWAIWMNKPKGLEIEDKVLYNRLVGTSKCYLRNVINRKGIPMLVLKGTLEYPVRDLNGLFIQLRTDFTKYIRSQQK